MSSIRPYRPSDRDDIYDICVRTGDSGADASGKFTWSTLLGDVYAAPYVAHDPTLAWVVDDGERAIGYIIATGDTREFVRWFRDEWWPAAGQAYPPEERRPTDNALIAAAERPERMLVDDVEAYPAHLHIDLLPEAQGQGLGRRLVGVLADALRERGIPGLHLTAGATNAGAIAFYERIGFTVLSRDEGGVTFGMRL